MITQDETRFAAILKQSRRSQQLTKRGAAQGHLKQTREEIDYYKIKLRQVILTPKNSDKTTRAREIDRLLNLLLKLRAKLALLALTMKHENSNIDKFARDDILKDYYRDCQKLLGSMIVIH